MFSVWSSYENGRWSRAAGETPCRVLFSFSLFLLLFVTAFNIKKTKFEKRKKQGKK